MSKNKLRSQSPRKDKNSDLIKLQFPIIVINTVSNNYAQRKWEGFVLYQRLLVNKIYFSGKRKCILTMNDYIIVIDGWSKSLDFKNEHKSR